MTKTIFKSVAFAFAFIFLQSAQAQDIPKWKVEDLKKAIEKTDKPTIFNFWATFCKPCLEEMPYFHELAKKYEAAGVQLVLVNLDASEEYPAKIKSIASKFKMTAPIKFLDETNADLFCPVVDKQWSGAIPASLFVNNKTGYRQFFEDQLSKEDLEKEIQKLISLK
jgi:thiol-disulfide isomerase/thioredoxin